ncbi:MAG: hypothetical protein ACM3ZE_13615 [Myxococcales bacterium]
MPSRSALSAMLSVRAAQHQTEPRTGARTSIRFVVKTASDMSAGFPNAAAAN